MFDPDDRRSRRNRGGRRNRGAVKAAVLLLLAEQPRHGYEILTELAARSDGAWRPSPGSIYPVLKSLTKEGLVQPEQQDGRRTFHLTDNGRELVESRREAWGEPWSSDSTLEEPVQSNLQKEAQQLAGAVWQIIQVGDEQQQSAATAVLSQARRSLYLTLAGEEMAKPESKDQGPAKPEPDTAPRESSGGQSSDERR